jgi:membrane-associated protease RseP (regulator of RpoE activity)
MLFALGVIVFAIGLLLSIGLHELGHLAFAKRFGVKVTQYMVGFGPTIWSRHKGETEYGIKAIPMGGYIRMIGMVPPAKAAASRWPRRMATLVEDFRRTSRDEVLPADRDREFYRLPVRKRVLIMLGGPFVNLGIYVVLMAVALCGIGTETLTNKVASVAQCIVPATSSAADTGACPTDATPAPAANVLQAGDKIVAINGTKTSSWDDTVSVIEKSAGVPLDITVERDGARRELSVTPVANTKYADDTDTKTKTVGMIGVTSTVEFQRTSILDLPGTLGSQLGDSAQRLAALPARVWDLFGTVFQGKPRDPNGAVGVVGLGRIGGEIASTNQIDLLEKAQFLLGLIASLNLLLFLFNMIPLLPLDGGHVAGAVYEAIRRRLARARQQPDPGAVDTAQMLPVMYAVASVMGVVSLLVLYADIVSPINLFGT